MKKVVRFEFEKETKNTIRFQEVLSDPLDSPVIGPLYVQKSALKELGYREGARFEVTLEVK